MSRANESGSRPRRGYRLGAREQAALRTRQSILEAAERLFDQRWYDEVSLADIAREAGVSQPTVINHFGSKEGVYLRGIVELVGPRITAYRSRARVGDPGSIVSTVVGDYEQTGIGAMRMRAQAERSEGVADAVRYGRRAHRDWVATVFTPQLESHPKPRRDVLVGLLASALDVATWHQLRHLDGLGVTRVRRDLQRLVDAILGSAD